ncbi:MAG: hypothetical protein V4667_00455 [Bacteroidota bacterium]
MISVVKKYEPYFFLVAVIVFCAPILLSYRFITLDGPAHLYNSKIIYQLLFNENSLVDTFFTFNNFPNPNYFYHSLATFLFIFFNDIWVEKIIAIVYVFLFCYGFRQIVKNAVASNSLSYIAFPFIYSFTFLIGFYNFSFSIAFLFWFIALISKPNFSFSKKNIAFVFVLYTALYFSHLMVFFVAVLIAITFLLLDFLNKKQKNIFVLIPALPFLIIGLWFIITHANHDLPQYLDFNELKNWLIDGRDIICRDYSSELFFARAINYLIIVLLLINLLVLVRNKRKVSLKSILFCKQSLFLTGAIFSLFLFLIAPNNLVSGGYLTVRLLLFFHLFALLFIVYSSNKNSILNKIISIAIFVFSLKMLTIITQQSIDLGNDYKEYVEINNSIKNQSVVLPIDYSNNWLNSNYGCYIGSAKSVVVLDNYEASTVHFPLVWKNNNLIPVEHMKDYGIIYNPSLNIPAYELKTNIKIDYVVRWKYAEANKNDTNNIFTDSILNKHFVKVFESTEKKAELFKHKN